jgi:beta-galactosidase
MFDFGSYFRREGDHFGINDKGMVTFDRKTKKDAFYFYKANWSDEPVLHIASKKFVFREKDKITVKVYSNLNELELNVNGKRYGTRSPETGIAIWEDIALMKGNNGVIVSATKAGVNYTDDVLWVYESPYSGMRLMIKVFDILPHATTYGIVGLVLGIILWVFVSGKKKGKLKKYSLRFISVLVILASLLIIVAKIVITNALA